MQKPGMKKLINPKGIRKVFHVDQRLHERMVAYIDRQRQQGFDCTQAQLAREAITEKFDREGA